MSDDDPGEPDAVAEAVPEEAQRSLFGEEDQPDLGPDPPEPDPDEYGPAATLFVKLVVVFDVAMLALALGPMVVYFEGEWAFGGALFGFGALTFAYGVARYYRFRARGEDNA